MYIVPYPKRGRQNGGERDHIAFGYNGGRKGRTGVFKVADRM